jgi:hypothetical protein
MNAVPLDDGRVKLEWPDAHVFCILSDAAIVVFVTNPKWDSVLIELPEDDVAEQTNIVVQLLLTKIKT